MYKSIIRPLLFLLNPETAHKVTISLLKILFIIPGVEYVVKKCFCINQPGLSRNRMGIRFPNPVGLAAGFDKNAGMFRELSAFGFGFIEVGTVTPLPQPGNDKPRMFRLPLDRGLINRMGFNNDGVDKMVECLKKRPADLIIGGNIGKNKITANESAVADYEVCFRKLFPYVDYFVVNVSSPNTPGLRELQDKEPLTALLKRLMQLNDVSNPKPVLLKIAPDLSDSQLNEIVEIVKETGIQGIVATNTTVSREGLKSDRVLQEQGGGLSGMPVRERSTEVIRYLREKAGKDMVIIGVGGIFSTDDAREKLEAGADLLQVYTGFIYEGPAMVKRILEGIGKP